MLVQGEESGDWGAGADPLGGGAVRPLNPPGGRPLSLGQLGHYFDPSNWTSWSTPLDQPLLCIHFNHFIEFTTARAQPLVLIINCAKYRRVWRVLIFRNKNFVNKTDALNITIRVSYRRQEETAIIIILHAISFIARM